MKSTKKIMFAMFVLSVMGMAVACGNSSNDKDNATDKKGENKETLVSTENLETNGILSQAVAEVKKNLPISIGMVGEMTDFDIEGNNLLIEARVNETMVNIDALKANPQLMHENMVSMITNSSNPSLDMLVGFLEESNMGLKLVYVGKDSGKRLSATLTSSDIKEARALANEPKDPIAYLDKQMEMTNSQMPMDMGSGMVGTKVVREGNNIVYYFECDESMISIDAMKENVASMKTLLKSQLSSNSSDPTVRELVRMCKDANVGIKYKYTGNRSGKSVTAGLNANELE